MQNLISINLPVGDRSYRLKIKAEDEETVRKMAKKMNEQLNQFKSQYPGKDMQDYLAMSLLSFVTEEQPSNAQVAADHDTTAFLSRIEASIDKGLMD
jgi:cell division protein ZapA